MIEKPPVVNENYAPIQITADQLILDSVTRVKDRPHINVQDRAQSEEEAADLRFRQRQIWEQSVRRNLISFNTYIRYARWEEQNGDLERARSVYERALEWTRFREPQVWDCYIDMELRMQAIKHAFNLLERAITILPRVDKFWLKYAALYEKLENIPASRQIFQRWVAWEPPVTAFLTFAEFETRAREYNRARSVFERLLLVHPYTDSYIRYADFEIKLHEIGRARKIFERALETLSKDELNDKFLLSFAQFEEKQNEIERARAVYKIALSSSNDFSNSDIQTSYLQFEKRYGGEKLISNAVLDKKRLYYIEKLKENPKDYDLWFELCHLLQDIGSIDEARKAYEDGAAHVPENVEFKTDISRYVLFCLSWAEFEELNSNPDQAEKIYKNLFNLIPHRRYTFARFWILYAYFWIRQGNIEMARRVFGNSIGRCPRSSVFSAYIEVETLLGNSGRVHELLKQFVSKLPNDLRSWVKLAEFYSQHGKYNDARKTFREALDCPDLHEKEQIWATYIDFESKAGDINNVRSLFRESIQKDGNISEWRGLIMLEAEACNNPDAGRLVFIEADEAYQSNPEKRHTMRKLRVRFEEEYGTEESKKEAEKRLPTIKEDGTYVFPEDEEAAQDLLAMAAEWDSMMH